MYRAVSLSLSQSYVNDSEVSFVVEGGRDLSAESSLNHAVHYNRMRVGASPQLVVVNDGSP